MLTVGPAFRSGGIVLSRLSRCICITAALAVAGITVAGCAADSRMAANNASSGAQASADTPAAYGITSDGPTTDLYTELFGSSRRDNQNEVAPAALPPPTQQAQPLNTPAAPQQAQPATASTTNRQGQRTASTTNRQVQQPAPPPPVVQAAQQPAPPQPPPEPDAPAAYGITSNGPTTDLYTEIFGPRRRDGQ